MNKLFGRNRPVARGPRLSMSRYLSAAALPTPPAGVNYATAAQSALSRMYMNDQLGCCVLSGIAHLVGLFTGNAGGPAVQFTDAQIISLYSAIGGYVPGDPNTDQGCNEIDALNYWQNHGALGGQHRISGSLVVDPTNIAEVKAAMWLFENLFFGIEIPDAWAQVSGSGFVWDAGTPNPNNGHCVVGAGYDSQGIQISTWGMLGTLTYGALTRDVIAASGGELHVVISEDIIAKASARAPNGFDWAALAADFDKIGGTIPAPTPAPPAPPAPPTPSPVTGPTKAQALAAVTAAINSLHWTK